jgi:hypothetical protein
MALDIVPNAFDDVNPFADDGLYTWSRKPAKTFTKGFNRWNEYNDPTYLGFVFMFDWAYSPLLNKDAQGVGNAVGYLNRIGETLRAKYLTQFIELLQSINMNTPWYWQSFEGGEEMWKYNGFKDPYKGGDESVLTVECLESIDLKMTLLMDLYRKAIYDQTNKRIMVPENLRKFEMEIYVQEVRKFQVDAFVKLANGIAAAAAPPGVTSPVTNALSAFTDHRNENAPYIRWRLKFCEFDPDASSAPFAGLNMMHGNNDGFAKQKMAIKYELIEEPGNFYGLIETTVSSTDPNVAAKNDFEVNKFEDAANPLLEALERKGKDAAKKLVENLKSDGLSKLGNKLNTLLLGNVYGQGNEIRSALQGGTVQSLGPDLINAINKSKPAPPKNSNLGNAFT